MRFVIQDHGRAPARTPGQVPSDARLEAMRLAMQPPVKYTAKMVFDQTGPVMSALAIVGNLGLDPAQQNDWVQFLEKACHAPNEVVMRHQIWAKAKQDRLDPALSKAILQRARIYRRDTLNKAEPRGGSYYRRVKGKNGRWRYYYSEDKYHASRDAHLDGESGKKQAIRSGVAKMLDSNPDGCDLKQAKGLVSRYGSKVVGQCLNDMKASGEVAYKNGRLTRTKGKPAK